MTSSHEIIQQVVDDAVREIELLTSTTLVDAEKIKATDPLCSTIPVL